MGLPIDMFYEDDEVQSVTCDICMDVLEEPKSMSVCGHHFCGSCLDRWIEIQGEDDSPQKAKCPKCRVVGSSESPSTTILAKIATLPTKCWYHIAGCNKRVLYGNISSHARHCSKRPMPCPRECGVIVTASSAATHLLTCDKNGDALTASLMCYDCRFRYLQGDRPEHCNYYRLASKIRRDFW